MAADATKRLVEKMQAWQSAHLAGQTLTAEQLAVDCPELLPEISQLLTSLAPLLRVMPEMPLSPPLPLSNGAVVQKTQLRVTERTDPGYSEVPLGPSVVPVSNATDEFEYSDLPATIGEYEVIRLIGEGGMGRVFEVKDLNLQRHVALKVMRPEYATHREARERFLREARSAAAVRHEHIIDIYHIGEHNSSPFLVMPLLRGEPLDQRLRRSHSVPIPDLVRWSKEIAEGLAAAHEANLIHRDIKPANIWLEGTRAWVKILDFGLARFDDPQPGTNPIILTQHGEMIGTPAYMPPEQASGLKTDFRGDLFSLGCVIYQMAAGHRPFQGDSLMAVMVQLATYDPTPLSLIAPGIPIRLSMLVQRLLAKKPEQRPKSANEVAAELRFIEDEMLGQTPVSDGPAGFDNSHKIGHTPVWTPSKLEIHMPSEPMSTTPQRLRDTGLTPVSPASLYDHVIPTETPDPLPQETRRRPRAIVIIAALLSGVFVFLAIATVVLILKESKQVVINPPVDPGTDNTGTDPKPELKKELPNLLPAAPLDALDASTIPEIERFAGTPRERVGLIGNSRGLLWQPIADRVIAISDRAVAIQVDGKQFASLEGNYLRLWQTDTLVQVGVAHKLPDSADTLIFHPTNGTIVVGDQNGWVRSYPADGKAWQVTDLFQTKGRIHRIAFSPDGKRLALSFTDEPSLEIWDMTVANPKNALATLRNFGGKFDDRFIFAPNSQTLAVPNRQRDVLELYEIAGKTLNRTGEIEGASGFFTFTPDSKTIYAISYQKPRGRILKVEVGKPSVPRIIDFNQNDSLVDITLSDEGRKVWIGGTESFGELDQSTFTVRWSGTAEMPGTNNYVVSGQFAVINDARTRRLQWSANAIFAWDMTGAKPRLTHFSPSGVAKGLALFDAAQQVITTTYEDAGKKLPLGQRWKLNSVTPQLIDPLPYDITLSQPSPSGRRVVYYPVWGNLKVDRFDQNAWTTQTTIDFPKEWKPKRLSLSWSASERFLMVHHVREGLHLVDLKQEQPEVKLIVKVLVSVIGLGPNDQYLYTRESSGIHVYDLSVNPPTGVLLHDMDRVPDSHGIALTPDAKRLAVWSKDTNHIELYKVNGVSLEPIGKVSDPDGKSPTGPLAISPDGKTVLSSSCGRLKWWDVEKQVLRRDLGYVGPMQHLEFSPDGRHIIAFQGNQTVAVYRLLNRDDTPYVGPAGAGN